jgi:hypothetical protein
MTRDQFLTAAAWYRQTPSGRVQRRGQNFMNAAAILKVPGYDKVDSEHDCYYDDDKIPAFLDSLFGSNPNYYG